MTAAYTWGALGLVSEHVAPYNGGAGASYWYTFGPQGAGECAQRRGPGPGRQLTDSNGFVVDSYTYTAYGYPAVGTHTIANPFRYGVVAGYRSPQGGDPGYLRDYTDPPTSPDVMLCGLRWYRSTECGDPGGFRDSANLGTWLSRDPIGYDGGPNLLQYCDGDPVNSIDPSGLDRDGNIFQYLFSHDYVNDVGEFFGGEASTLNPISMMKGIYSAGRHIYENGASGAVDVGRGLWNGLQFWNKGNLHDAGASFFTDLLIAAPLIKKIPNFTPLKLSGPYLEESGCTVINVENVNSKNPRRFGFGIGRLPVRGKRARLIPTWLRGRMLLHYHRRGPGGIGRSRPWEGGPGGFWGRF